MYLETSCTAMYIVAMVRRAPVPALPLLSAQVPFSSTFLFFPLCWWWMNIDMLPLVLMPTQVQGVDAGWLDAPTFNPVIELAWQGTVTSSVLLTRDARPAV